MTFQEVFLKYILATFSQVNIYSYSLKTDGKTVRNVAKINVKKTCFKTKFKKILF